MSWFGNRKRITTSAPQWFSIAGMEPVTKPKPECIKFGPVTLRQFEDGLLVAEHAALSEPVTIDARQLQRWLLRQLRDQVTA